MIRKLMLSLCLALSLTRGASASPVTPVDVTEFGREFGTILFYQFHSADFVPGLNPSAHAGWIESGVWFNGATYLYAQTLHLQTNANIAYSTEFEVKGFTGVAGWLFEAGGLLGGTGTAADFRIEHTGDRLVWLAAPGGALGKWDAEPIIFFFESTRPPTIRNYNLFSLLPLEFGAAEGMAPVPEPASVALFGSGLIGLYAVLRRRRTDRRSLHAT